VTGTCILDPSRRGAAWGIIVTSFTRKKPVRTPFPEHLPRERVVIPQPGNVGQNRVVMADNRRLKH